MSFMNPVDMVEEDAADLQFPKVGISSPRNEDRGGGTVKGLVVVRPNAATKYQTTMYPVQLLNSAVAELAASQEIADARCSSGRFAADQCVICEGKLQEPFIKCPDCEISLCVDCFAHGSETATHRNSHPYVIVRDDVQVFPGAGKWVAREERILLRTLRTHGYGNWEAVSRALHGTRTPDECRQHYHECYFGGIFQRLLGLTAAKETYFPERMPYVVKMNSVDPPRHDDITSTQFKITAGYRCARGDFDTPYDVSAESILTLLQDNHALADTADEFTEEKPHERERWRIVHEELQCALVRAYNHRLRERNRRYRIMRDNGLIMTNRTLGWITKCSEALGSETNCTRFLSFMQICNPIRFDMLVESLQYFVDIRKAIHRLYELRQNGIRSLTDATLYYRLKTKRVNDQRDRAQYEQLHQLHDWRKLIQKTASSPALLNPFSAHAHAAAVPPRKKPGPMDIIGLPGYAKLSEGERRLCSVERIVPQAFLDYKNILVAENVKIGNLRLADARRLIKIDVNKTRQIYDYLIENGHINRPT